MKNRERVGKNDLRRNHSGSKAKIAEMPGLSGLQRQPAREIPGLGEKAAEVRLSAMWKS